MKEQYDRQRKSNLQIDSFSRIFSIFCLKTYVLEKIEFNKIELIQHVKDAIRYENIDISFNDLIFDLEEAVCLLQREGLSYFFVHRSFQEYFTALFLAHCPEDVRDTFIDEVCTRHWDNVLSMLYDMASSQLEPSWVARNSDNYIEKYGLTSAKIHPLFGRFRSIILNKNSNGFRVFHLSAGPAWNFISAMRRFYPEIMQDFGTLDFDELEKFAISAGKRVGDDSFIREIDIGINSLEGNTFEILISDIPMDILEKTKITKFTENEFKSIKAIRSGIGKDQEMKSNFLNSLFKES
ncbi:hypothetical protein [Novosphingobium sp. AAP83]|uniref:hypothetical protein n=1 Tax=Novosphingobium sp. AAP83 TaxID=1523425 RepID=UPI0012F7AD70|nr:hypothetical protein [Novosphingobium sp. AAP83]